MIYSVRSDQPTFKPVEFQSGFNMVLAERLPEATKKDSRNGLGKTTLIEIIHFCLGSNKEGTLAKPELDDWTFTLEMDLFGRRAQVSRNTAKPAVISLVSDFAGWPEKPSYNQKLGEYAMNATDWRRLLGLAVFAIPEMDETRKYKPSFRSLVSFFIRNGAEAFVSPFSHCTKQQEWDKQIHNAYLLGLDWEFVSCLQILKDRTKVLKHLKQEVASGMVPGFRGSLGELEAERMRLEGKLVQEQEALSTFQVIPQYRDLEREANELTNAIHGLVNDTVANQSLMQHYQEGLVEVRDADSGQVASLYAEAGIEFPRQVTKRLDDVHAFHRQVVTNRCDFLKIELARLERQINHDKAEVERLTGCRAELMGILEKGRALDEYTALQKRYQATVALLENIKNRAAQLREFEKGKSELEIEQSQLWQQAQIAYSERELQRRRAAGFFNANSEELYDAPGNLSLDVTKTGYRFGVDIKRSGSGGIEQMKIFCYDLMLAQLWAGRTTIPLIHDSTLFADVDERQRVKALELAARESQAKGFQYICMFNSDNLPVNEFTRDFDYRKFIRLTLTDAREDGGLLGFRF
jgi:uncharacterized protein YydD (DUF2326 family)